MSFAALLAEDRRLLLLQALAQMDDFACNEAILKRVVARMGHKVGGDLVRADLEWLKAHALVRLEALPQGDGTELWVAHLLEAGQDVAGGRAHPGVARPRPA